MRVRAVAGLEKTLLRLRGMLYSEVEHVRLSKSVHGPVLQLSAREQAQRAQLRFSRVLCSTVSWAEGELGLICSNDDLWLC